MSIDADALRALLAKVEEAKGGSRELDGQLTAAFDPPMDYAGEPADIFIRVNASDCGIFKTHHATPASYAHSVPYYTTSLDAALALVAKVLPGWFMCLCIGDMVDPPSISMHRHHPSSKMVAFEHHTPPLVILRAMLEAILIETEEAAHVER